MSLEMQREESEAREETTKSRRATTIPPTWTEKVAKAKRQKERHKEADSATEEQETSEGPRPG